jgi:hypothetical protein
VTILGAVIKVPASDALLNDLEELKRMLGASTNAEAVRRIIARELLLLRAIDQSKELIIQGKNPKGKELHVLL